jgi:hypothetical protein
VVSKAPPSRPGRGLLGNRLLDALPPGDRRRITPLSEREHVHMKQPLYEPGGRIEALYFPVDAVASILTTLSDGAGVEIATVGNEGMLGSPVVLGSDAMPAREFCQVQVPGDVLRMDKQSFAEVLSRDDPFREVIQLYVQALFTRSLSRWPAMHFPVSRSARPGGCCSPTTGSTATASPSPRSSWPRCSACAALR